MGQNHMERSAVSDSYETPLPPVNNSHLATSVRGFVDAVDQRGDEERRHVYSIAPDGRTGAFPRLAFCRVRRQGAGFEPAFIRSVLA